MDVITLYPVRQGRVAQWTRARGYGPRCRGFESLLVRYLDITSIETCRCTSLLLYKIVLMF